MHAKSSHGESQRFRCNSDVLRNNAVQSECHVVVPGSESRRPPAARAWGSGMYKNGPTSYLWGRLLSHT